MKKQYTEQCVTDEVICYSKYTHPLLIHFSPWRKFMQITSSRDNESASAAGFNEAECREEKENLMGKKV